MWHPKQKLRVIYQIGQSHKDCYLHKYSFLRTKYHCYVRWYQLKLVWICWPLLRFRKISECLNFDQEQLRGMLSCTQLIRLCYKIRFDENLNNDNHTHTQVHMWHLVVICLLQDDLWAQLQHQAKVMMAWIHSSLTHSRQP